MAKPIGHARIASSCCRNRTPMSGESRQHEHRQRERRQQVEQPPQHVLQDQHRHRDQRADVDEDVGEGVGDGLVDRLVEMPPGPRLPLRVVRRGLADRVARREVGFSL